MSETLLVGTTKGAFLLASDDRESWDVRGPFCDGWPINHAIGDPETGRLWAAGGSEWHGTGVWASADGGATWELAKLSGGQLDEWAADDPDVAAMLGWTPRDAPFTGEVEALWSLGFDGGRLFAGAKPAQLLESADGGRTWSMNDAFRNFPDRDGWSGGGAGLILHTIVTDPEASGKMWLGVSAAGVFASEDGGGRWERRNRLSNADACGEHSHPAGPANGETGHCVHNMVRAGGKDLLYQQNHHGVWKSPDGGRTWTDINEGLPSTFGFPIAVHPRDERTVWTLPLNGDSAGRYPPDASAAVWKSSDGGESWSDRRDGLPARHCFFTVLRQAMATDRADPVGVYFGTNSGSVFASRDEGESWSEVARHLPAVLSVETLN